MILNDLSNIIADVKTKDIYLYFITRVLKPDMKKTSRVLDKYQFKVYQVEVYNDIREHLHQLTIEQLDYLIYRKSEIHEYDVITDDTEQLFTYQMKNKAMSFSDVVEVQLKSKVPVVKDLESLLNQEELWAYCVGFNIDEDWIYTFRKILAGKVAIDEGDSQRRGALQKFLRTRFNTNSSKLELIEGQTINLDKQLDCIYYKDTFYIARKTQFEQIVGLETEYKNQAEDVAKDLKATKMIIGMEVVANLIESTPSIHKKLVRLSKVGNYNTLDAKVINKMKKVAREFGDELKVRDGKLLIEDEIDVDITLKMLADYYKEGKVSGKSYGTYAGRQLTSS